MDSRDASRGCPLEERRQRLPLTRIDPRVPAERVEQELLTWHQDLEAEHPMLARRPPCAQRAEARCRRGGEPSRDGLRVERELGEERRGGRMVAELFPAERVDDQ
jgi:hypothetical protein